MPTLIQRKSELNSLLCFAQLLMSALVKRSEDLSLKLASIQIMKWIYFTISKVPPMLNLEWSLKTNLVSLKLHAAVDLSKKV